MFPHRGSKRILKNKIFECFPKTNDIHTYIEPFVGGGSMVLSCKGHLQRCTRFIASDLDDKIINIFNDFKSTEKSIIEKYDFVNFNSSSNDRLYQNLFSKMSTFNGDGIYKCKGKISKGILLKKNISKYKSILENFTFKTSDYKDIINQYFQEKNILFYCDPPYYETNCGSYPGKFDHNIFFSFLEKINEFGNKFIVSYNDCSFIRKLYEDYNITTLLKYKTGSKVNSGVFINELVITNYE